MKSVRFLKSHFPFRAAVLGGLFVLTQWILGAQKPYETLDLGTDRYLTHISTDKPIYRVGERLYVRGVVLRADGHVPLANPLHVGHSVFEIKGPKGEIVTSGTAVMADSVVAFSWDIPQHQSGGEYTIRISPPTGDAPAERKFEIRAYRAPRLKSQIVFARDGYGPGDTVSASLHVERAEGGFPAGARVAATARVDGTDVWKSEVRINNSGDAGVSFKLPTAIQRGEGAIGLVIQDGGIIETAAKTIPILLQTMDVSICPEGGDLIAGLTNRVYVEARTPAQKPADMAGIVQDSAGRAVAEFRTEHEGRGRFSFVPARGETYSLRIAEPSGIKTTFKLPAARAGGVVLASPSNVIPPLEDVVVRVTASADGAYGVGIAQRGKEIAYKRLALKAGHVTDVPFTVPRWVDGVVVATVYNDQRTPLAERLLFRQPEKNLKVKIVADETDYVPGDKVTLRITTTDETGKPVPAVVGLAVTDSTVLEMIDKREQAPRLPVMVLLDNDVRDLADAHVYLDETNPKAALATDLLLGTQGWRRFATVDVAKFLTTYKDPARRALAARTLSAVSPVRTSAIGRDAQPPVFITGNAGPANENINGWVVDASNALIPGVTVQATNVGTGVVTTVVTNEGGFYVLPGLIPGAYDITASLPGFQTMRASNVPLVVGSFVRQDFPMTVASVATEVEVRVAAPAILYSVASSVGEVIGPQRRRDPPPVGNNNIDLNTVINPDLVGEIRLILSPVDAELGRGNASVAISTRSGTNRYDGGNALIREFAHKTAPNRPEGERTDFSETVYWNAAIKTDASTGAAKVSFDLSDSVTSFSVLADVFTQTGALASSTTHIESLQPFSIEPKMPLQVTSGDVIQLPIGIVNGMNRQLSNVDLSAKADKGITVTPLGEPQTLDPKERSRNLVRLDVANNVSGMVNIAVDAKAGRYRDSVTRQLDVRPLGFPHELSAAGLLEKDASKSIEFTLPSEMVRGSVTSAITVYPTPLANMTDALKALVRQPSGCFEQTSSTSYPLVMAQQYFLTHRGVDPSLIRKTRDLLDGAYTRLLGFQSKSNGYDWFGSDPGHEALTAYGLMQFTDMAQVRSVDPDMMARTRGWLLSRRDGKGGFNRNSRALDSFGGAPSDTTNAYIVWALVEAGEAGLEKEIARVKEFAASSADSYIVALAANILLSSGDHPAARKLMDKLVASQHATGGVGGAVTSITRSGGQSLEIETTALALLAWMRESAYTNAVMKGLKWINNSNSGGRFGSTQSTILALRSIVAYDKANGRPKSPGRVVLSVDGKTIGVPIPFTTDTQTALVLPEVSADLGPGKHKLTIKMENGSSMPFSVNLKYNSTLPDSSELAQVGIKVGLPSAQIGEGDITEATVSITNKSADAIPTPVAIIGIPGGLEVRHDQLKELVKSGRVDAYEVRGREVVLYWRYLKANDTFDLPISLVAAIPGSYEGPASRAYLYYTDEFKNWAPGLKVGIAAR